MTVHAITPEAFDQEVRELGALEKDSHHIFASGVHGQKLDMGIIKPGTKEYEDWLSLNVEFIYQNYDEIPEVIIGVANGTNELALDIACEFGDEVRGFTTKKLEDNNKILLPLVARTTIFQTSPDLVLVIEDVGTRGTNSIQPVMQAKGAGAKNVQALTTYQRRDNMEILEEYNIPYKSIIAERFPDYTPEDCQKIGWCALGWEPIPHGE